MSKRQVWETEVNLRFRDFDYLGHMTATSYLALVEEARVEWMGQIQADEQPSYVVARQCIDFHEETLPADSPIKIRVSVEVKGSRSVEVQEQIFGKDDSLKATSNAVLVAWNREERKSRNLTEEEIKHMS